MIYALQHAAKDYADDIKKFSIVVNPRSHMVGWRDHIVELPANTSREVCKRYVRSFIKQAKEYEAKRLQARQVTLL